MRRRVLSRNRTRLLGVATLFLGVYIVVIGIFGRVDISGLLPTQFAASLREAWPNLPIFAARQDVSNRAGGGQETYYTVPTRQFSAMELARMGVTNSANRPAAPR